MSALRLRAHLARAIHFALDHGQDGCDQRPSAWRDQQSVGIRPFVRHDRQPPELRRGIGQGLGPSRRDALVKGYDLGQGVLPAPADFRAFDGTLPAGSGFAQFLEAQEGINKPLFEGDKAFRGGGHGAGITEIERLCHHAD